MATKVTCIFCDAKLTPDTKPEHILLNALGGRKTTRRVICSKHNEDFGSTIDAALTKQVNVFRNLLQFESGTGRPPPMLKNLRAGPKRVNIGSDGRPELATPPFKVTTQPDGTIKVEIHAHTPDAIKKSLPHLAARLRITESELIKKFKDGQAAVFELRPGQMHHGIVVGGEQALRSVAKACLVLLATVTGNEAVKAEQFAEARAFVLKGSKEFSSTRAKIDSRDVPGLLEFKNRFGPFFNLINVRSDEAGRVIGHFTLYNAVNWQIVLAETGGPRNQRGVLVSNPIDPATWNDDTTALPDIPFAWLDAIDRTYEIDRVRERLIAMMEYHVEQSLESEYGRIIDDVFDRNGIKEEEVIGDPGVMTAIYGEIAARIAEHALGLVHQEPLMPEDIEKLIQGKLLR